LQNPLAEEGGSASVDANPATNRILQVALVIIAAGTRWSSLQSDAAPVV
jgi:hypothetical protein